LEFTLPRLNHRTRADHCYETLKTAIINLQLPPGSFIDETGVAAQLGVSKTPVREALARLAGEGFIESDSGRRSRVTELSLDSIREVYEIRIMLECASLRKVGPTLTDEDFDLLAGFATALERSFQEQDTAGEVASAHEFHMYLIVKSGNRRLTRIFQEISDQADRVRALIYHAEEQSARQDLLRTGVENHKRIIEALRDGDIDRATRDLERDIRLFMDAAMSPMLQDAFKALTR
jgi:DNA-binding GntR family transcriptional regulator